MFITIPGKPIAKQRHRDGKFGKFDPQHKEKNTVKALFKLAIKRAYSSKDRQVVEDISKLEKADAFEIMCVFYMPIPRSLAESKRNRFLWGFQACNKKPDCSNMLKFYEDAANEVLYDDDAKIVRGCFRKEYSTNPRTEITLMPANSKKLPSSAEEVLAHFSPIELYQFCDDASKILNPDLNSDESHLVAASHQLALFAEKYADKLKKIKTKYASFKRDMQAMNHIKSPIKIMPLGEPND